MSAPAAPEQDASVSSLPSDARLVPVRDAARELRAKKGGAAILGGAGSGPALLARALVSEGVAAHVLYVAADAETACDGNKYVFEGPIRAQCIGLGGG